MHTPKHIPDLIEAIEGRNLGRCGEVDRSPCACLAMASAMLEHADGRNWRQMVPAAIRWLAMALEQPTKPEDE